ncbi:hypothetical protein Hdeb2414_s0005g00178691 [Helianthus debilis subsp. tardiflorus]
MVGRSRFTFYICLYVRPGAAPMPGAGHVATGGAPAQVRPPGSMLSFAGRGRGEWHPAGAKKFLLICRKLSSGLERQWSRLWTGETIITTRIYTGTTGSPHQIHSKKLRPDCADDKKRVEFVSTCENCCHFPVHVPDTISGPCRIWVHDKFSCLCLGSSVHPANLQTQLI